MASKKQTFTLFADAVRQVVKGIPKGQVMSYRGVAERAGFKGAARAVGTLMKDNYDPTIPCHRVICADGELGQYNRGRGQKEELLRKEGVVIEGGRTRGLV